MVFHHATHSTTGQTPLQRWDAGWAGRRPVRKEKTLIAEAFRWSTIRTVTKSATVSSQSNTYQVDQLLVSKRVELVHGPFDVARLITVSACNGVPAGIAVLSEIRRHVHKKAASAAANYLQRVQTANANGTLSEVALEAPTGDRPADESLPWGGPAR